MVKRYKIKIHKLVTTEDSRHFDTATREKIKRKIMDLLLKSPEEMGEPLRLELAGYRKLKIFDKYRIVYRVEKALVMVFVLAVGIRRDNEVYREAVNRLKGK